MIKIILKTMFGLVVLVVAVLAMANPYILLGVLVLGTSYWIGKSMLG